MLNLLAFAVMIDLGVAHRLSLSYYLLLAGGTSRSADANNSGLAVHATFSLNN